MLKTRFDDGLPPRSRPGNCVSYVERDKNTPKTSYCTRAFKRAGLPQF